jgi:hypothetical protein
MDEEVYKVSIVGDLPEIVKGVTVEIDDELPRHTTTFACLCGGDNVIEAPSTPDEINGQLNCNRDYACCCVAFTCPKCGLRYAGSQAAPEYIPDYELDSED